MNVNCAGKILSLDVPAVMAIINLTPDSFYKGGDYNDVAWKSELDLNLKHSPEIADLGGMSSRPGAEIISAKEEWGRIENALKFILTHYPNILVSVDTIHAETACKALDLGAHIINDISAGSFDENMIKSIAPYHPAYIMMHMKGNPKDMQSHTDYENLMLEIIDYFKSKIAFAKSSGINEIILDPGFGFSKTIDQNYSLLNNFHLLKLLTPNLLAGISRKSMIYKTLGLTPKESLNGTSVLHLKALQQDARILRVHDVKEAQETIMLFQKLSVNK